MRNLYAASLTLACLLLPACETMGGASTTMPTSVQGVAESASTLANDLTGFLGKLDTGNLMGEALAPLQGYIDTGKQLLGSLDSLPAVGGVDLGGLKDALGGIANFDLQGLMSAAGGEQTDLLGQLKDAAAGLGQQASALLGG